MSPRRSLLAGIDAAIRGIDVSGGGPADEGRTARASSCGCSLRSKTFIAGAIIVGFWIFCAIFGELLVPEDPLASDPIDDLAAPSATTGSAPTGSGATCSPG